MNRLEKKCTITAASLHGLLLVVILLAGSGFFRSDAKVSDATKVITLINPSDLPGAGGGNPNANPNPPPPPPPVNRVEPTPPILKPPEPPVVKNNIPDKPLVPVKPKDVAKPADLHPTPVKSDIKVNTTPVKRNPTDTTAAAQAQKDRAAADARDRDRRTALADTVRGSLNNLNKNFSPATTIEPFGPGGEAFTNYGLIVKDIYDRAWLVSDALGDEDSSVKVSILIARDGTVLSARIIKPSGVPALDKSVQRTLNDVKTIVPFPAGSKDTERRFDINFNLKAKRLSA